MEQEVLPIKYKISRLKLALVILAGVFLLLLVFLNFWSSKADRLLSYFPKDTIFYFSLKADHKLLAADWVNSLPMDQEVRQQTTLIVSEALNQRLTRNFAYGILPDGKGTTPMIVLELNRELDPSNNLFGVLKSHGYLAMKVNQPFIDRHILIITKQQIVLNKIREVINDREGNLGGELSISLELQRIPKESGVFVARLPALIEFLPENWRKLVLPYLKDGSMDLVAAGISSTDKGILIKSPGYFGNQSLALSQPEDIEYGFIMDQPTKVIDQLAIDSQMKSMLSGLEQAYNFNYEEDIKNTGVQNLQYLSYVSDGKSKYSLGLASANKTDQLYETLKKLVIEYLAVKNQRSQEVALPDGSKIREIVKNREGLEFSPLGEGGETLIDPSSDNQYFLKKNNDQVFLSVNKEAKDFNQAGSYLDGCEVNNGAESLVLGRQTLVDLFEGSILLKSIVISTYPQGYPQFMVCAR